MTEGYIAGSVAGATGLVVGHPFDTIKVRLQTSQAYTGVSHCVRKIVVEEGFRALYKGMLAPMASVSAMNAVFFGVYTAVLQRVDTDLETPKISSTYIAGTASGILAGFISGPIELIKCRLQVAGSSGGTTGSAAKSSNINVIRHIIKTEGVIGLGRGLGITIGRETISCGLYFATYEWMIQFFRGPYKRIDELTPIHMVLAGGVSGMASWGLNYPVDVVKSRIQIDGMEGPRQYNSSYHCFLKMKAATGWNGLYRGVTATLMRAFPTNAAMLPAYSISLNFLMKLKGEREVLY